MIGQGSPRHRGLALALAALLVLITRAAAAQVGTIRAGDNLDVRLRFSWGGGAAQRWNGRISLDSGRLSDAKLLGVNLDVPGSMRVHPQHVQIHSPSVRTYDGIDLRVRCPKNAQLVFYLRAEDGSAKGQRVQLSVADILKKDRTEALDRTGNRFLVRRSPGDSLRAVFERDSLVFRPGERFEVEFQANQLTANAQANYRVASELFDAAGSRQWRKTQELRSNDQGQLPKLQQLEFDVPDREGVYNLVVSITPRRLGDNLLAPAARWKRNLQLIVLNGSEPTSRQATWKTVGEFRPDSTAWGETWKRIRSFNLLPYFRDEKIQHGQIANRRVNGQPWIELAGGSWRAYPLPGLTIGKPHILEVQFSQASDQTLLLSLLEPNASGQVMPLTLDSGVEVGTHNRDEKTPGTHRIVFWPKTRAPVLLLSNRSESPALFGRIRVLAGPDRLPAPDKVIHQRTIAAFYHKPYFPENFGAPEQFDKTAQRSLPSWLTYYHGADRLIQYLKWTGHNTAFITVAADGSAIYPSRGLQPTPKFDAGIFFENGQDPIRKDVLEMLFRMFDRAGLKLVPAIRFATPLPQLEQLHRNGAGIDLTYRNGQSWRKRFGTARPAALYNPLHDRVQRVMRDVVGELVQRYGKHKSFAGVHVDLGANSYAMLPSELWGCDGPTLAAFAAQLKRPQTLNNASEVFRSRRLFTAWLNWRARRMAKLYYDWAQSVAAVRDAKLYLGCSDVWRQSRLQDFVRPTLPSSRQFVDGMLRCGLDANLIDNTHTILCRPIAVLRNQPLHEQTMQVALNGSYDMDSFFGGPGRRARSTTAAMLVHSVDRLTLPSFDEVSPFGKDKTRLLMFPHISAAGSSVRRHFIQGLATLDSQVWIHGGWMVPQGQEQSLQPIFDVFRRLPRARFTRVKPKQPSRAKNVARQPAVMRKRSEDGRTWFYVVNHSHWPLRFRTRFLTDATMTTVGDRKYPRPVTQGPGQDWVIDLEPYDLVAVHFDRGDVEVADWRVELPAPASANLQRHITEVKSRLKFLKNPKPLSALSNPGFEQVDRRGPRGWIHNQAKGVEIRVQSNAAATPSRSGKNSLYMKSTGPVAWVRSHTFRKPVTGRIFMLVWLRTSDPGKQPPLRLAVEAPVRGDARLFYRFASVGNQKFPLKRKWGRTPYLFPMDRLPLDGVDAIRVGFDLMGPGEVWIDDVLLYDLYVLPREQSELRQKFLGLAEFHRKRGNYSDSLRILEGYWPRFVEEYAGRTRPALLTPASRLAVRPEANQKRSPAPPDDNRKKKDETIWQRMKGIAPRKWFPFF